MGANSGQPFAGLPAALTALLGRARELAGIDDRMRRPDVRLVTVTGVGGVGKTRLAIEAAWRVADEFDEMAFVSLASLREAALVVPAVAHSLGISENASLSPVQAVAARLDGTTALLVLDNLEHLPGATGQVAELLEASPGLSMLATSRSALRIRGEQVLPLAPLPLPRRSDPPDADALAANPAVALFVERAHAVDPTFTQTTERAPIIAEICRRLDGLPLAIELAAVRINLFSPAGLLARLDDRLALLTEGARDLPDRLRTIRAAVAWSYDLLSPAEQRLFCRLAVFVGGASLRAVEIAAEPAGASVIDRLAALVSGSLLQRVTDGIDEPRFVMLETIREFGLSALSACNDVETANEFLAEFCLALAETAFPHLSAGGRERWLIRIELEHDNIRAALVWLIRRNDARRMLRLTGTLWQFWWWRSHLREGHRWVETALSLPGADDLSIARALSLTGAGALSETLGDYASADVRHEAALAVWTELGDRRGRATTLLFRWLLAFNNEDQERMTALATESLTLFLALGDEWGVAMSSMELGVGAMRRREIEAAIEWEEHGLRSFRRQGDRWGAALCLGVLGNVHIDREDYAKASLLLRESLDELSIIDDRWGIATILPAVARLAMSRDDPAGAVRVSGAAVMMSETLGAPLKAPFRSLFERNLALARTLLGEERYAAEWSAGQGSTPAEIIDSAFAMNGAAARPTARGLLSPREVDVLRLLAQRQTSDQIADLLFISYRTVTTHVGHILDKLGVGSRYDAVDEARRLGVI